jgi:hypothetical protein
MAGNRTAREVVCRRVGTDKFSLSALYRNFGNTLVIAFDCRMLFSGPILRPRQQAFHRCHSILPELLHKASFLLSVERPLCPKSAAKLDFVVFATYSTTKRFNAKNCVSAIDAPLRVPSHGSSEIRAGS